MGSTRHSPLSFRLVEPLYIDVACEELVAVCLIFARLNVGCAAVGELVGCEPAHHLSLSARDIAEVVTVFSHDLDSVRIKLIVGFGHEGTLHTTDIATDALAVVDACNLQDAQVVVDRKPTAISTTLWQWTRVRT